jgi:hypothetical protein
MINDVSTGGRAEKSALQSLPEMQMRQFLMSPPMPSHDGGAGSGNEMLNKWFIARPTIFCEIAAPYLERHDLTPAAVFDLLRPLGYQSYLPTVDGYLVPAPTYQMGADYFFLHPATVNTLDPQFRQRILHHAPST